MAILMLTGPLASFTTAGEDLALKHSGLFTGVGEKQDLATWPLTVLFGLIATLSFLTVFSYRNRMRQMRLSIFLMFISGGSLGMMFYYIWLTGQRFSVTGTLYQWRFVLPLVAMVLFFLAFRMIRRDELLVKAYDRIR